MNLVSTIKATLVLGSLFGFLMFSYGSPEERNVSSLNPSQELIEPETERAVLWYVYNGIAHIWSSSRPNIFLVNKHGPTRTIGCGAEGTSFIKEVPAGQFTVCSEAWGKPTTLVHWGRSSLAGVDIYGCTARLECTKYFSY